MSPEDNKTVVLAVLDGWGMAQPGPGNAISLARTPNMNSFWASYPHTQISASGQSVGLPKGESGNTETGHLNLGAGRIVYQDLERINISIADGSFFKNEVLIGAFNHAKENKSKLHLLGLIGAGGVHSNIEHLFALIQLAKKQQFNDIYIHLITDGRDSPPTSSQTYINLLRDVINREGFGKIASIMGRYWAMDRDRRWDRTEKAYLLLTQGLGQKVKTAEEAITLSYSDGITDEFLTPSILTDSSGNPIGLIGDNDSIIFYNFRIDRPRQLTAAFLVSDFTTKVALDFDPYLERYKFTHNPAKVENYQKPFNRAKKLNNLYFATMTEYSKSLVENGTKVAFPPEKILMPLARIISSHNLRQLHASESEKERFVTFYFNGQQDQKFPGEDRLIVPSPNVQTYDKQPEMSAYNLTAKLIESLKSQVYSFIIVNFANPDMVGHTGNIGPAVKACEVVDECTGKIASYILAYGGTLLITADHGNVEEMINTHTGQIETEHSANPVPFIAVSQNYTGKPIYLQAGMLADIAVTVLSLLSIEIPTSMTGKNLLAQVKKANTFL